MGILDQDVLQRYIRMCDDGWLQGWHERNAGNLTYRMTEAEAGACKPYFKTQASWVKMDVSAPGVGGEFFITSGTGKYFRNFTLAPEDNICIAELSPEGDSYRVVWGLESGGGPTSEFSAHMLNHSVRKEATGGKSRVIYHSHPAAIVAMTYLLPLTPRDFTRALWKTATECPVVFPGGVGIVGCMVPGSTEIAQASAEMMKEFASVIWAHHGIFCSGSDFDEAFGLLHTIEKTADIYLRVHSCNAKVLQTISDQVVRDIARAFRLELREDFLD